MTDIKETVTIKQVHDNDKYIVTRQTVETMNGAELVKIYNDMDAALKNDEQQLKDLPIQMKKRVDYLNKEKAMVSGRIKNFERYVKKIKELAPKPAEEIKYEDKKPQMLEGTDEDGNVPE